MPATLLAVACGDREAEPPLRADSERTALRNAPPAGTPATSSARVPANAPANEPGTEPGTVPSIAGAPAERDATQITSAIELIMSDTPRALVGRPVSLEAVPVSAVTDRGLWIGVGEQSTVAVALAVGADMPRVRPGQRVDVVGSVAQVPEGAEPAGVVGAELARRGKLGPGALYVRAVRVTPMTSSLSWGKAVDEPATR